MEIFHFMHKKYKIHSRNMNFTCGDLAFLRTLKMWRCSCAGYSGVCLKFLKRLKKED